MERHSRPSPMRHGQEQVGGTKKSSAGFVYPAVMEIKRAGGVAMQGPAVRRSQRALVEASLLRCPDTREARRGPDEHKVSR